MRVFASHRSMNAARSSGESNIFRFFFPIVLLNVVKDSVHACPDIEERREDLGDLVPGDPHLLVHAVSVPTAASRRKGGPKRRLM